MTFCRPLSKVFKMNEELTTYPQMALPGIIYDVIVSPNTKGSQNLLNAKDRASTLLRMEVSIFFF